MGFILSPTQVVAITLVAAAIVAYAQYLFKKSVPKFKFNLRSMLDLWKNKTFVAGVLVYFVGLMIYLVGLGSGQLSFVYPAFSSTFIFVLLISHFKLNEKIGYKRLGGIALIILGIALVSGVI